ncbi:glycosyltransferase, partial [Undibacterium sp. 10I3]
PTQWQRQSYPSIVQDRIEVIHDGIDTDTVKPDPAARFQLPDGRWLTSNDEVITFVNRNLEPCRGFMSFMRSLPDLLRARPHAEVLILGGDSVSYGQGLLNMTWRQALLEEVGSQLDLKRVHFLGKIPYTNFLKMLQISSAHIYLTYPFILSWSMLEAMAAGCVVVGSRTAPVEEVILDQENGYLVDFFDTDALVRIVASICSARESQAQIRLAARQTILDKFDLKRHCLPKQI